MTTHDEITEAATGIGKASFHATFGRLPDNFSLLAEHAPGASIMRDQDAGGALDLKTKELVFALLDTLIGQKNGAKNHAAAALKLGLTLPELAEGLVQVIMAGGITTWNETGADVMRHCVQLEAERNT